MNKPKQKRRSQHAKDQVELKLEVSHCTTNLEEDRTEVRHQEEATSNQPVPEETEIPSQRINSTHHNQYNTRLKQEKYTTINHNLHLILRVSLGIHVPCLLFNKSQSY